LSGEKLLAGMTDAFYGPRVATRATAAISITTTVDVASLKTVDGQYGCRTWTGSYQMTLQGNQWLIERSNITPQACSG
jgi:hypothetical protein